MNDWKQVVASVAPGLATMFAGPLAGGAVKILADKILADGSTGDQQRDESALADMLAGGLTPEIREKIIAADKEVHIALINAGVREKEIEADSDKATLADVADARKTHGDNHDVLVMGVIILIAWAFLMAGTLYALHQMLVGGIQVKDVGVVATVFTVLGSLVGYVSNVAQQVVGFFFGSSRGSAKKTDGMVEAISSIGKR